MERILNQSHSRATYTYAWSRLFERASYYGLRSLIIFYMIGETLKMSNEDALSFYGWFTASFIFSKILGAVIGDLVLSNKKALIIGGLIQSMGAFILCIPSTIGLYIGMGLVVLGGGLYTPNIISHFGKLYLNRTKLLDSAFTIVYLAVFVGSFIGPLLIGYLGETFAWNIGFAVAGILMLISIAFPFFTKESESKISSGEEISINERVVKIIIAVVLVALFWSIYEISNIGINDLLVKLREYSTFDIPKSFSSSLSSTFVFPVGIIVTILWSYFYSNQFIKLTLGFIFGALSFGVLFLIPDTPTDQHIILYLISFLFLSISEIHIKPIIYSILTQYANPKYLAIFISLVFIPSRLFTLLVGLFKEDLYLNPLFTLKFGLIVMGIISVGLIVFIRKYKP